MQKKTVHLQRGSKIYNDQLEQPGTYSTGKKYKAVVQMSLYIHRLANKPLPFCKHGKFSIIVELKTKVKVILLMYIATDFCVMKNVLRLCFDAFQDCLNRNVISSTSQIRAEEHLVMSNAEDIQLPVSSVSNSYFRQNHTSVSLQRLRHQTHNYKEYIRE